MSKLELNDVNIYYGDFHAVQNVNMQIPAKAVTAFIGPSGCGKSTVLRTLNRMHEVIPNASVDGEVLLDGHDIYQKGLDVAELRRRGTIEVLRGRHGGAMIAAAGLDQRVGELVRSLSSRDEVIDCAGRDSGVACPYAGDCRLRGALHRAREAFLAELDTVRIRDLVSAGPVGGPVLLGLPEIPVAH